MARVAARAGGGELERFDSGWQHPGHARGTRLAWLGDLGRWDMGLVELQLPFYGRWVVESFHLEPTAASKQNQTAYLAVRTCFLGETQRVLVLDISVRRCRWNGSKQNWKCTRWRILLSWSRRATITPSHKGWLSPKVGDFFSLSGGRRKSSTGPGNAEPWKSECEVWSSFGPPAEWGLNNWIDGRIFRIFSENATGMPCSRHFGFQLIQNLSVGHQETFGWRTEAAGQSTKGRRSIASWDPLLEHFQCAVSVLFLCGQSFEGDHDRQTRGTHFLEK